MAAPAGSRLRLVCSNCTTLCEVSIPASATQKPVRYQVRCPNCKTVNDPQIARTTNGVAEVVGPNSSAKRKASPTVRAYASPLCALRAHAPRSLAAQNGPPRARPTPTTAATTQQRGGLELRRSRSPSRRAGHASTRSRRRARRRGAPSTSSSGGRRRRERRAAHSWNAVGARPEGDPAFPRASRMATARVPPCPPSTSARQSRGVPRAAAARRRRRAAAAMPRRGNVNRGSSRIRTTRRRR